MNLGAVGRYRVGNDRTVRRDQRCAAGIRHHRPARPRCVGGRPRRPAPPARSPGRDQAAPVQLRHRRGGACPLRVRGTTAGLARPPARRAGLRLRRSGRPVPDRHGATAQRLGVAAVHGRGVQPAVGRRGRARGGRRAQVRARPRHPAPRHQAREPDVRGERDAEGHRLRHRRDGRRWRDAGHSRRRGAGHACLHGTGAGARADAHTGDGRVRAGHRPLRAAGGPAALPRRDRSDGVAVQARLRPAGTAARGLPRSSRPRWPTW